MALIDALAFMVSQETIARPVRLIALNTAVLYKKKYCRLQDRALLYGNKRIALR